MDEKRIKLAEDNFKIYLKEGKIQEVFEINNLIYNTYIRNARESLNVANLLSQESEKTTPFRVW